MTRAADPPNAAETVAGRIQQRLDTLGLNPERASRMAGGSPSLIPNILNGRSRHPRIDTLAKIAPVLQTSPEWLATGRATPAPARPGPADYVELRGTAHGSMMTIDSASLEGFRFAGGPPTLIPRPPGLTAMPNAYAVIVRGDSQAPADPDGALRFVDPDRAIRPGDTVIVTTRHFASAPAQQMIKLFVRRDQNSLRLEMLNPKATLDIPLRYVEAVHRVLTTNELFGV